MLSSPSFYRHSYGSSALRAVLLFAAIMMGTASASAKGGTALAESGSVFPNFSAMRRGPSDKQPASCTPDVYGSMTTRAPDGALSVCHAGFNGKLGFWEQQGTGQPCWKEKK